MGQHGAKVFAPGTPKQSPNPTTVGPRSRWRWATHAASPSTPSTLAIGSVAKNSATQTKQGKERAVSPLPSVFTTDSGGETARRCKATAVFTPRLAAAASTAVSHPVTERLSFTKARHPAGELAPTIALSPGTAVAALGPVALTATLAVAVFTPRPFRQPEGRSGATTALGAISTHSDFAGELGVRPNHYRRRVEPTTGRDKARGNITQ